MSAVTESTYIPAPQDADTLTSRPIRLRFRWAPCSRSDWRTYWRLANVWGTHVTNGCYRLHPVEWNVGEAAGALAAFGVSHRVSPRAVRSSPALLADFQRTLASMGVQLHWPVEI